ncbi:hypothetical protein [Alkalihalobacillus sp. AL-G]|uniref:hypothetical protein n=1 Tax=Alkalihalobacillus sp. AL-G TaxID=2926399 RepID=UPI0027295674|nr:hypothetical protein [Alkalihalobacillus sp. AL-G]WLD92565.1 hypothetical protein MOJ78_16325 [Alkalihalobacillus sp. AL-G]
MSQNNCRSKNTLNLSCNLFAINSKERSYYYDLRNELSTYLSVKETTSGYTFIYPNRSSVLIKVVKWISYEYQCCPFIHFSINVSGESDVIEVDLTGNEVVRNLLKEEFNL